MMRHLKCDIPIDVQKDTVTGYAVDLPGNRLVFVGRDGDGYWLHFRRPDPEAAERICETRLRLSPEAFEALTQLCVDLIQRGAEAQTELALAGDGPETAGDPAPETT